MICLEKPVPSNVSAIICGRLFTATQAFDLREWLLSVVIVESRICLNLRPRLNQISLFGQNSIRWTLLQ